MKVLLPALGKPTERHVGHQLELQPQPTLLAGLTLLGEARRPALVARGTWRCPARPGPPAAARKRSPWRARSARAVVAVELVDDRALGNVDLEVARPACRAGPCPCRGPRWSPAGGDGPGRPSSDATLRSATSHTSPPLPPSPPLGPPWTTGPSRRKLMQPAPPSPPRTFSPHSSTKVATVDRGYRVDWGHPSRPWCASGRLSRGDRDPATPPAYPGGDDERAPS